MGAHRLQLLQMCMHFLRAEMMEANWQNDILSLFDLFKVQVGKCLVQPGGALGPAFTVFVKSQNSMITFFSLKGLVTAYA